MADIHRLPDERRVLEEASEWIARLQADDVTAEDRVHFEEWRDAHPLHRRTLDELTGTWNRFMAARPLVNAVAFGQSMNETAARAEADPAWARSRRYRLTWAAVLAVILVGFSLVAYLHRSRGRAYVTAIGEHATVLLSDGSTLELDGDSRARVEFSEQYRVVRLERGEAFFKVAHNVKRPFWVLAGRSWVRDVGTAFNVMLSTTGMRVTVSQGTVKVGTITPLLQDIPFHNVVLAHEAAISELSAGNQAYVSGTAVIIRSLSTAQLTRAISWRAQMLYFENAPLSEVVHELEQYTRLRLVISNAQLCNLPLAGTFEANPQGVETFLSMLTQGLGLAVTRGGGKVLIQLPSDAAH